jgi:hypothetical protein
MQRESLIRRGFLARPPPRPLGMTTCAVRRRHGRRVRDRYVIYFLRNVTSSIARSIILRGTVVGSVGNPKGIPRPPAAPPSRNDSLGGTASATQAARLRSLRLLLLAQCRELDCAVDHLARNCGGFGGGSEGDSSPTRRPALSE